MTVESRKGTAKAFFLPLAALFLTLSQALAEPHFIDLSKAANRGLAESFDEAFSGIKDLQEKNGLKDMPVGPQTFRGIPFQVIDPTKNQGRSFVVLKGRRKPDFPDGVSIPTGNLKTSYLYFLHTCRWGGTAQNITVAEYDIVYDDGQVTVIPLRVGVEFTNFFGADDTASSFLAWWHKYKNTEMGVNLFPWKNPRPDQVIQSILFKSRGNMPVPLLFAITASDKELPVSPDSPKPEKTFQTDTSEWIPFESSDASPVSTAIDMSFLLDAPAGKHGKVKVDGGKLVFEDGTPARFWGMKFNNKNDSIPGLVVSVAPVLLPIYGINLISFDPPSVNEVKPSLKDIVESNKAKGIYVELDCNDKWVISNGVCGDPAVVPKSIWVSGQVVQNGPMVKVQVPFNFDNKPMVLYPEQSFPGHLNQQRILGTPFLAAWFKGWPNEYLAESSLLMAAYGSFENWAGCLNIEPPSDNEGIKFSFFGSDHENEKEAKDQPVINQSPLDEQSPVAALAYLRGDIKEGRVYVLDKDGSPLKALAHKSGFQPENGKFKTDAGGLLKAKVNEKTKSFVSDTGQISWQGNVGVVKVESPRFQALIGFLSHRKFNNAYWAVETPNPFASLSVISLNKENISLSDHLLVTGVTRMENTGQIYNAAKTKLISPGMAPILVEPLSAKFVLYRPKADPKLKVRALDVNGQPIKTRVSAKWVKNSLVFSWIPSAFYLEIFK